MASSGSLLRCRGKSCARHSEPTLIAPLYAFLDPSVMFVAGGLAVFVCALVAASVVDLATRRYRAAAAAA